jgi:hypothetical protein
MIRASGLLALPFVLALVACGDDSETTTTSGTGGDTSASTSDTSTSTSTPTSSSSGDGGADATTSTGQGGDPGVGGGGGAGGGTGGGATFEEACSDLCTALQEVSDGLECGEIGACETEVCDDDPSEACAAEQIAVYQCLAVEASEASCFCEGDGEIECEDICSAESQALDACEEPFQFACIDADDALFSGLDECWPESFYDECYDLGDSAYAQGCDTEHDAYTDCVIADGGASCTCDGGVPDCDDLCAAELEAVESCIAG